MAVGETVNIQDRLPELREKVALACRILAMNGLVQEAKGHVSARTLAGTEMVIRCRGRQERGLAYTDTDSIRQVDFDGRGAELGEEYETPSELPIHGELYKARGDIGCVVHAHPTAALLCTMAGLTLRPIIGAYDPAAMKLAAAGIPVHPRSITLTTPEHMAPVVRLMEGKTVCLLRGHGMIVTGKTVEDAAITALKIEGLARLTWQAAQSGKTIPDISAEDIAYFHRDGARKKTPRERWIWKYYVSLLDEKENKRRSVDP